mmetsp:Transcript_41680/g.76170  ORF Transcript_41680/g.76170 Transcript_41680/m.76170 type:complete len:125 (-) Transcript_41680:780-1154(-)
MRSLVIDWIILCSWKEGPEIAPVTQSIPIAPAVSSVTPAWLVEWEEPKAEMKFSQIKLFLVCLTYLRFLHITMAIIHISISPHISYFSFIFFVAPLPNFFDFFLTFAPQVGQNSFGLSLNILKH